MPSPLVSYVFFNANFQRMIKLHPFTTLFNSNEGS
jgi:hypothetical protein